MNIDVERVLGAAERSVKWVEREGRQAACIVASRLYDTPIDDAWDALTNKERIPRWFLPIQGELKLGGRYQFEGNAGGTITACERPKHVAVTWEFGGTTSWVDVTLAAVGDTKTRLTLEHAAYVDEHWEKYGPGAGGVGWEGGLLGLELHLASGKSVTEEGMAWAMSDEGKRFYALASDEWCKASIAFGTDAAKARAAADATTAFYTGEHQGM